MGPNEAEPIARNILASHGEGDDGGGVPGKEVLGCGGSLSCISQPAGTQDFETQPGFPPLRSHPTPGTLLSGLISQVSVSLSSWKPAWRRRLRHSATAAGKEASILTAMESGRGHPGPAPSAALVTYRGKERGSGSRTSGVPGPRPAQPLCRPCHSWPPRGGGRSVSDEVWDP